MNTQQKQHDILKLHYLGQYKLPKRIQLQYNLNKEKQQSKLFPNCERM